MMQNLKEFVAALEARGMLKRVRARVSADQEIPEIHRRVIAAAGPALLFERVEGSAFPVVTNLFGTAERMDIAFGEEPIAFMENAVRTLQTLFPPSAKKIVGALPFAARLRHLGTRSACWTMPTSKRVDFHETSDLTKLPLTTSWPEDGGAFLTLPLVYTEHPEGFGHNLGIYRMQRFDASHLGMHWQIGKGGGFHYHVAEKKNQALPVVVHLGGPPALLLSACAPLPENVGELLLAGFLAESKIPLLHRRDHALPVVASAEFALLGHVPPRERRPEGPFGDHYGYYSLQHDYPVFRCEKILHAKDAILPATVVGKPRQEDFFIGEYLQRLLRPLFPLVMPSVSDLWSYGETGFHSLAAAVVRERYEREAVAAAFRILGEGQLSLTKFLLLVDRPMDLTKFAPVLEYVLERADFTRDLYVFNHLSLDTLDYTGPEVNKGSKGVLLGIGQAKRALPVRFEGALPAGVRAANEYCRGCLVVEVEAYEKSPTLAETITKHAAFRDWPMIVLVDDLKKALHSEAAFLWTTFTRFEPAADIHAAQVNVRNHHVHYEAPIAIDARMKPKYPKELFCDERVRDKVTKRWSEYFPEGQEQGSSDLGHL